MQTEVNSLSKFRFSLVFDPNMNLNDNEIETATIAPTQVAKDKDDNDINQETNVSDSHVQPATTVKTESVDKRLEIIDITGDSESADEHLSPTQRIDHQKAKENEKEFENSEATKPTDIDMISPKTNQNQDDQLETQESKYTDLELNKKQGKKN